MKKLFTAALAAVLSVSMVFSSLAAEKLAVPQVRWSSEQEAIPEWTRIENAGGKYRVEGYRNGERFYNHWHHHSITNTSEYLKAGGFPNYLEESGNYTFRVMALGDGNNTLDSDWSAFSEKWTFVKPSIKFGTPTNLRWDGTVSCWDALSDSVSNQYKEYLAGYEVRLYGITEDGEKENYLTHNTISSQSYDEADWFEEGDGYTKFTFAIRAISNTPSVIFHGDLVECPYVYDLETENTSIQEVIDSILDSDDPNVLNNAPDTLQKDRDKLQVAMQTDKDILNQVEELEQAYAEQNGIETAVAVSDDVADDMDADKIHLVGLGLNAAESDSTVTFQVTKPNKEVVVDAKAYKDSIQFNFNLKGAVPELKVPIRITVPIPESINPDHFAILHYHADGTYEEISPLLMDIDPAERTATFTVTSFSTFVFANYGADIKAIATPSNATELREMIDFLPDIELGEYDDLSDEEKDSICTGLAKITDALNSGKISAVSLMKDGDEDYLQKLSTLLNSVNPLELVLDDEGIIAQVSFSSPAANVYGKEDVCGLELAVEDIATSSNASTKLSFAISMYELDEDGERIEKVHSLKTPLLLQISVPEEYGYTYKSTDKIIVGGGKAKLSSEDDCLVILTSSLGKFTIKRTSTSTSSGSKSNSGREKAPAPVKSTDGGFWSKDGDRHIFVYSDGTRAADCWLELPGNGTILWYHFNKDGIMDTGWFKDGNNWFYLNETPEGVFGGMVTGWKLIDGKWYYFHEISDGFKGLMLSNTVTPDGYQVGSDGAWIQ